MSHIRPIARSFFAQPGLRPGCYDDPAFLALEQRDSSVIEDYGAYVLERQCDPGEELRARVLIEKALRRLVDHIPSATLQRRCADVNQLLIRVLEQHDIWSFGVTGAARYEFDRAAGYETRYAWAIDEQDFPGAFVGHAWLVVPPFDIVDCTAHFQSWESGQERLIPCPIMETSVPTVEPDYAVSVAPVARPHVNYEQFGPLRDLWRRFPPRRVSLPNVTITYQAHGISVPAEPLSEIRNLVKDPVGLFANLL